MFRPLCLILIFVIIVSTDVLVSAKDNEKLDPAKRPHAEVVAVDTAAAGPDFAVQGEYVGEIKGRDKPVKCGAQIIALGNGKFHAVGYYGGLPGDGWDEISRVEADGQINDGALVITGESGSTGTISLGAKNADAIMTMRDAHGNTLGTLRHVHRTSPTLGQKPPAGAIVLFDGSSAAAFVEGRVKDGLLMEGTTSKQRFQSYKIHLEFMIPFMPTARGQGRGNSGYYSQGRYETQILDSFGLDPRNDDCAAIYGIATPRINMCYPPLSWQTYDIDYTAAEYKDGQKIKNACLTVRHNGVEVQKDTEAPHATTAAPIPEGPEPGPVYLQNHGNPVRFRNIWVVERK
jgi:hypothetical protein